MDLQPLWDWFRVLHDTTGIKLTIFYDAFDRGRFIGGFLTSIRLMGVCLVASVVIGVIGAWIQGSRSRILRLVTQGYIQFFRNTPPLVQLYFFYFALGSYLKIAGGNGIAVPVVSNFTWAAICLSFYAGAFNVEIFRAGIEAVPRETMEAAESLGYSRLKAYVYIILPLGLAQISLLPPVRFSSWFATQFFRNSPWLVLLFYCMLLLPFEVNIGGTIVPLPGWLKSTIGLSLPVMANVSELVRGAVRSIPFGQWEAADSLAMSRRQTLSMIILPQCIKRMTPPWMNLYAILTVATPLTSVVGVSEAMTLTGDILSSEARTELLVPMYLYLLLWFFIYCYPIARATIVLEQRFQVR